MMRYENLRTDGFRTESMFGLAVRGLALLGLALTASACVTRPMTPQLRAYSADKPVFVRSSEVKSCVHFAREKSGIEIYGDAHTWWDQSEGRYARERNPRSGSLLVLNGYAGPERGHLAVVTRILSPREIRVDHANWLNDGNIFLNSPVIDVSPANDWSMVRVWNNRDGHLGANNYPVQGFISAMRVAHLAQ